MTTRRRWLAAVPLLAVLLMLLAVLGQVAAQGTPAPEATPAPAVVREVLSRGVPIASGGDALELVRYTIPRNMTLPAHTHPGMQVAWYRIRHAQLHGAARRGAAPSRRGSLRATGADHAGVRRGRDRGGGRLRRAGGVEHFGRSGDEGVVILVTSLFDPAQPPSLLATPAATPAP